jgi:hypothetical protein
MIGGLLNGGGGAEATVPVGGFEASGVSMIGGAGGTAGAGLRTGAPLADRIGGTNEGATEAATTVAATISAATDLLTGAGGADGTEPVGGLEAIGAPVTKGAAGVAGAGRSGRAPVAEIFGAGGIGMEPVGGLPEIERPVAGGASEGNEPDLKAAVGMGGGGIGTVVAPDLKRVGGGGSTGAEATGAED